MQDLAKKNKREAILNTAFTTFKDYGYRKTSMLDIATALGISRASLYSYFENKDDIRHQWMIHGLPKYLYPKGMFHIEVNGVEKKTGTFIVPSSNYTYLVHCDISQHMEKGMKAQLKVGNGRGDLPSIPGISDPTFKGSL